MPDHPRTGRVRRRRTAAVIVAVLALGLLPAVSRAGADPVSPAAPSLPAGFRLVDYPTGQAVYNLTEFAWLDDGALLTAGKDGTVTFVPPGGVPRRIGAVPGVRAYGDHGMLGLAPAPDYDTSGDVYVTYDKGDPVTGGVGMVELWRASPASSPTVFTRVRTLIDGSTTTPALAQVTANHGLDAVLVAPDKTLFVSVGDDNPNNGSLGAMRAQDLDQPYGKVLHLAPDGTGVATNPFYSASAPRSWRSMVYAYGLRNPFRITLDPRSGRLQLGDVGRNLVEEVDVLRPGDNAGWPCLEGAVRLAAYRATPVCQARYAAEDTVAPIVSYPHAAGASGAVVGGVHYTGSSYPAAYTDAYFYGDYVRDMLWTLTTDASGRLTRAPEPDGFGKGVGLPVAFHPGPNGDITFADLETGAVRRLVYDAGNAPPVGHIEATVDAATHTVSLSAADSYDPQGDTMTYHWDFGDDSGSTPTDETTSHQYADDVDVATVTLTAADQLGAASTTTLAVHPGDYSPTLTLTGDVPGRTYAVGDHVSLAASGTDPEDGDLPVTWSVALLHCPYPDSCHRHPDEPGTGASFDRPFTDHGADTSMLVTASVLDTVGNRAAATFVARPQLHTLSVVSPVPVVLDGDVHASIPEVTGATVQLAAPPTSSYWRFAGWSDGGAPSHALTMPDDDLALTASYRTAIDLRWTALGGARSVLGASRGTEHDVPGGRGRTFAHGRMYWRPATDAIYVTGGVLTRYLALGGPARLGLPRGDTVLVPGGRWSRFADGSSIWQHHRLRAWRVSGPVQAAFRHRGWQRSCLGFPAGGQHAVRGGVQQRFQHGWVRHLDRRGTTRVHCSR